MEGKFIFYSVVMVPIFISIFLLAGCTNIKVVKNEFFKINSSIEYNASLCSSIGYSYEEQGFNSGVKVVFKDKLTGKVLDGRVTLSSKNEVSGANSDDYVCQEGINTQGVLISAYAKGYSPLVFVLNYSKNQMITVDVFMTKSCSDGPSYFDNLKISSEFLGLGEDSTFVNNIIATHFGLNQSNYTLQCIEAEIGRGGYVKLKGIYKDGTSFELYHRSGWCSSGGSDCGWNTCFNSASTSLFDSVKNNFCNKLSSRQYNDGHICTSLESDNTSEVQNQCINGMGGFEKTEGNHKILSIVQSSNRCKSSVSAGNFNCLEN